MLNNYLPNFQGIFLLNFIIILDWIYLLTLFIFYKLRNKKIYNKLEKLKIELSKLSQKEQFKEYTLISREINRIKKENPIITKENSLFFYIRSFLIPFIFQNCYLCEISKKFFIPFYKMVSYPHNIESENLKIGFIFFWSIYSNLNKNLFKTFFKL